MDWRYLLARRLAFLTLIISVIMMILLPWPKRDVRQKPPQSKPEE